MKENNNSQKNFTVINPPLTFGLCICVLIFFVILVLVNTIFSEPPHTAMYVCITLLVFIPGTIITLWTKMFRVRVKGSKISVRKRLGLVSFSFDVSEITNVEWKIVETAFGENEIITVCAPKGKKVQIETIMVNAEKMREFIKENVDETKIKKIVKSKKK